MLLHRRLEQLGLAREVVVQQALRDPSGLGDLAHRDLLERVLGEQCAADVDQLTAALVDLEAGVGRFTHAPTRLPSSPRSATASRSSCASCWHITRLTPASLRLMRRSAASSRVATIHPDGASVSSA